MSKIINYKRFDSSESFVEWQKEMKRSVISVMPIYDSMSFKSNDKDLEFNPEVGCFVQFWEEIKDIEE